MDARSKNDAGSVLGGHLSYDQIEKYTRDPRKQGSRHADVENHLRDCRFCRLTLQDIINLDPYLGKGDRPPDGFWEEVWKVLA